MVPLVPTLRLIQIVLLGAPLWLISLGFPSTGIGPAISLAYLLLVAGLCVLDYRSIPGPAHFAMERTAGRFSLGAVTDIRVTLSNRSQKNLQVAVREELPAALETPSYTETFEISAKSEGVWTYSVKAIRRGRYTLASVVVRAGRRGGLVQRQFRIAGQDDIRIYPRFSSSDEYRLLARISEQDEMSRRPRRVYGRGTDFESLSQYYPGEDLRAVDWKISAKRGFLVTRNLQTERGQQVSLMIDAGRLMNEKIGEYSRFEYALNAAVMLSYAAQKRGDAVSVSTFSDRVESFVPPVRGTAIMRRVLESLCTAEARQVESDYWQVVRQVMQKLKRRSLVIMMTDVLDSAGSSGLISNLTHAASRHLVLCVVLVEPRIAEIADSMPENLDQTYIKAAACHLSVQRHLALENMRKRGILVLEAAPEELTIQLIRRYLEIRKANLQ